MFVTRRSRTDVLVQPEIKCADAAANERVRPQVVEEFRDKVLLLQKEKPLVAPAYGVLKRMISEVYP